MSKSNGLDFEELLRRSDLKQEVIRDLPKWDCDVTIVEVSAATIMEEGKKAETEVDALLHILAASMVSPRLTFEQLKTLYDKPGAGAPVFKLIQAVNRLNHLGKEEAKKLDESFPAETAGSAD